MRKVHEVSKANRQVKVCYSPALAEYECRLFVNGKLVVNATYYTDDKTDALGTAQAMVEPTLAATS